MALEGGHQAIRGLDLVGDRTLRADRSAPAPTGEAVLLQSGRLNANCKPFINRKLLNVWQLRIYAAKFNRQREESFATHAPQVRPRRVAEERVDLQTFPREKKQESPPNPHPETRLRESRVKQAATTQFDGFLGSHSLLDTCNVSSAIPLLKSPPVGQMSLYDDAAPTSESRKRRRPGHLLAPVPRQELPNIPVATSAGPKPIPRNDRDEIYCDHEDCRHNTPILKTAMDWIQHWTEYHEVKHQSGISKTQSGTRYASETFESTAARQMLRTKPNPSSREHADMSWRYLDLDCSSLGRGQHQTRNTISSTAESVYRAPSPAPCPFTQERGERTTEPSQQSQRSSQSTQDSYSYGVTYPYEDSFSYI
ncbi:hypothetical protein H2202_011154 [Exophiala xenobiotica]|nr:hypothetical protein H2202_011154 [Exophiala xenobiotica]